MLMIQESGTHAGTGSGTTKTEFNTKENRGSAIYPKEFPLALKIGDLAQ